MNFADYQYMTKRTERNDLSKEDLMINYALGAAGESGEIADMVKKFKFQGHSLNGTELALELGDVLYYISRLAAIMNYSLEEIAEMNIEKLSKRYPNGFTVEASVNRKE